MREFTANVSINKMFVLTSPSLQVTMVATTVRATVPTTTQPAASERAQRLLTLKFPSTASPRMDCSSWDKAEKKDGL